MSEAELVNGEPFQPQRAERYSLCLKIYFFLTQHFSVHIRSNDN
jgi:hypothetical protein